ncbi:MAG: hypothetical protein MI742_03095 [Desulfobacterales bacterium]|nr:hypothetical protein [Desulfobacterales bacterium]
MRKRTEAIFASLLILLCLGFRLAYTGTDSLTSPSLLIPLNHQDAIGSSERADVLFPHEFHTQKLGADSCVVCHDTVSDDFSFKMSQDLSGNALKDHFHNQCIECHASKSGPQMCSGCHVNRMDLKPSAFETVSFDHSLHEDADIACDTCHHKEPDTACAECHGEQEGGGTPSLMVAMHKMDDEASCLGCHTSMGIQEAGECATCHTQKK